VAGRAAQSVLIFPTDRLVERVREKLSAEERK
jgi:reverse gyrase